MNELDKYLLGEDTDKVYRNAVADGARITAKLDKEFSQSDEFKAFKGEDPKLEAELWKFVSSFEKKAAMAAKKVLKKYEKKGLLVSSKDPIARAFPEPTMYSVYKVAYRMLRREVYAMLPAKDLKRAQSMRVPVWGIKTSAYQPPKGRNNYGNQTNFDDWFTAYWMPTGPRGFEEYEYEWVTKEPHNWSARLYTDSKHLK